MISFIVTDGVTSTLNRAVRAGIQAIKGFEKHEVFKPKRTLKNELRYQLQYGKRINEMKGLAKAIARKDRLKKVSREIEHWDE
jgi:hypothetical protein